jgi:hypothetical protein
MRFLEIIYNVFELIFASPYFAPALANFTFLMDEQELPGISVPVTGVTILIL